MLLISILCLLLSNAVTLKRDIAILFNRIAILTLIYLIIQNYSSFFILNKGVSLHGGLLYITNLTQSFHIFIFIISILILQLTSVYPREMKKNIKHFSFEQRKILFNILGGHLKIIEYPLILLFIITGAVFLISTNDLVSIFLSIELQSYGLYLLSTIYRNSEFSTTGGLIYFLLGGLSSCLILLGISLLYANSGTTNIDSLYIITSISDLNDNINFWYKPYYINFSLLIFSIGFLFKIGAAPFHFWSPDVYDAIPTVVTTFVAIIAKISIFIFLLQLVYYSNGYFDWTIGLLISSLFSLIVGTLVGLTQFRIKRLLAYSTISHVGFILLALSVSTIESTQAFIFYLIQYTISNLNMFILLISIGFTLYFYESNNKEHKELLDKNNSPIQLINQLTGFFYINPFLSLSLFITIFSFIGIPPLIGFFAKQMVLSAALDNGYVFLSLIAILTSVIGAVYYLNIVKEIFFYYSPYKKNLWWSTEHILPDLEGKDFSYKLFIHPLDYKLSSSLSITISIITLLILFFIFMNKEWLSMCAVLVQILFNY